MTTLALVQCSASAWRCSGGANLRITQAHPMRRNSASTDSDQCAASAVTQQQEMYFFCYAHIYFSPSSYSHHTTVVIDIKKSPDQLQASKSERSKKNRRWQSRHSKLNKAKVRQAATSTKIATIAENNNKMRAKWSGNSQITDVWSHLQSLFLWLHCCCCYCYCWCCCSCRCYCFCYCCCSCNVQSGQSCAQCDGKMPLTMAKKLQYVAA